jgi:ABC-2 type transport system permease protein
MRWILELAGRPLSNPPDVKVSPVRLAGFWRRVGAVVTKEVLPFRRERMSFAVIFVLPILQLLLFGYAIETDPRHMPTAIVSGDDSMIARTILSAIGNTGYMDFTHQPRTDDEASELLQRGEVQFIVSIPADFTRRFVRGERAQVMIDADATDPMSVGNSLAAAGPAIEQALSRDLIGPLRGRQGHSDAVELVLHRRYNPEGKARLNIVPGLLAVILSVSMVLMTALAVTREREHGTMENLLAMPVRPFEVMIGKIIPYFVIGAIQTAIILVLSWLLFDITINGDVSMLLLGTALFITANLAIGFTISTLAENQLQAMQASFFTLLPSILLSGFMFPFRGMPQWAQWLGEVMPTTHFIRIARSVMLKAATFEDIHSELTALFAIVVIVTAIAISRYRMTLDGNAKPTH